MSTAPDVRSVIVADVEADAMPRERGIDPGGLDEVLAELGTPFGRQAAVRAVAEQVGQAIGQQATVQVYASIVAAWGAEA